MGFLEVARVEIVTFAKPVKNGVASGRDGGLSTGLFRRTLIEHSEIALACPLNPFVRMYKFTPQPELWGIGKRRRRFSKWATPTSFP